MKHALLIFSLCLLLTVKSYGQQTHVISTANNTFTPSIINASIGDQIIVQLSNGHSFTQVSKVNYLNNSNMPLSGGIQFLPNSGGGNFTVQSLDTIFFVSSAAATTGMKGKIVVSGVNGIRDNGLSKLQDLNIYPNPTKTQATLNFYLPRPGIVEFSLINAIGKKIKPLTFSKSFTEGDQTVVLETSTLPQGMYFVEVIFNNHKLVKRLYVVNE